MKTIFSMKSSVSVLCAGLFAVASGAAQAVAVSGQGTWEAALLARDLDGDRTTAEAYYDTQLGITWLADANFARTSGFDADGNMNWTTAMAWVTNLDPYGSGIGGWRLPTITDMGAPGCNYSVTGGTDCGYNVATAGSEMAHLFSATLGNLTYYSTSGTPNQPDWGLSNTGPFANIQSGLYWSGTAYAPLASAAWGFTFHDGNQTYGYQISGHTAWAVHAGDVGSSVSAVPLPAAAWLFGSGLLAMLRIHRRQGAQQ